MIGDDTVGFGKIAEIGETASDDSPLVPPFAGIDQLGSILRRLPQKSRRFRIFLLVAQVLHAREQERGIIAPAGIHLAEQGAGIGGTLQHSRPGIVKGLRFAEFAETFRLADAAAIHQIIHARLVVRGRQIGRKGGQHAVFHILVHAFAHPQLANESLRIHDLAGGGQRLGENHRALRRFWLAAAE